MCASHLDLHLDCCQQSGFSGCHSGFSLYDLNTNRKGPLKSQPLGAVVVHTSEFEACLVYRASSRSARATQRNPVHAHNTCLGPLERKGHGDIGWFVVTGCQGAMWWQACCSLCLLVWFHSSRIHPRPWEAETARLWVQGQPELSVRVLSQKQMKQRSYPLSIQFISLNSWGFIEINFPPSFEGKMFL